MSQARRLNGTLYSPVPSLTAANQSQIEDLVQRNKTLDVTHKKLLAEVKQERDRHKEELLRIKEDHARLEEDWRKNSYDLLGICRIHHKKVELALEEERSKVVQEMLISREEKLGRMKTDYKLKLYQMSHEEDEQQLADLEDQMHEMQQEHQDEIQYIKDAQEETTIRLKESQSELKQLRKAKDALQDKFHKLSEELANHHATNSTSTTKLERLKLQLEGASTKNTDLERTNDELKRTNIQLQRQIEDWQSLEKREGDEVDTERKQRVSLGVELEKCRSEVEKLTASLEKERGKVKTWKDAVNQWKDAHKEREAELQDSQKMVSRLEKQVEKLKTDLESERSRVQLATTPTRKVPATVEEEAEDRPPQPRKHKAAPKQKGRTKAQSPDASEAEADPGPSKPTQKARRAMGKKATEPVDPSGYDHEVDNAALEDEHHDAPAVVPSDKKGKAPVKGKRKRNEAADEVNHDAAEDPPKKKAKPPLKLTKEPVVVSPPVLEDESQESAAPVVKKKRKINQNKNIFPKNADPFNFGSLDFGAAGGLDIPSTLSPVRPDAIPPRSDNRRSGLR